MTTFATDTFSLPYPDAAEPPNGPQQIQDLASETETTLRQLMAGYAGLLQDGVLDATDCMVEHVGPPARSVQVAGGLAIVDNSITVAVSATVAIDPAHGTLPRIDRIVLSAAGEFSALTGSPTSGATIDNAETHGAVDPTGHGLLLADVRVPAAATTIDNTLIRDRRKWARGAYAAVNDATGAATSSSALTQVTGCLQRVECSGAPVRVTLATGWLAAANDKGIKVDLFVDGAALGVASFYTGLMPASSGSNPAASGTWVWEFTPAAGSHLFVPAIASWDNATLVAVPAWSNQTVNFIVEEVLRQRTKNNATTSG